MLSQEKEEKSSYSISIGTYFFYSVGLALILGSISSVVFWKYVADHNDKIKYFWGELFQPDARDDYWKMRSEVDIGVNFKETMFRLFVPPGGPSINREFFEICSEHPLSYVPIKITPEGEFQALCGIGEPYIIEDFVIKDIKLRELFIQDVESSHPGYLKEPSFLKSIGVENVGIY